VFEIEAELPSHNREKLSFKPITPAIAQSDRRSEETDSRPEVVEPFRLSTRPPIQPNATEPPDFSSLALLFQIKALVAKRPGILETELICNLLTSEDSDIHKACSYAERTGLIIRKVSGRTYSLRLNDIHDDWERQASKLLHTVRQDLKIIQRNPPGVLALDPNAK